MKATRAEGEQKLRDFIPRMGRRYTNGRNTDHKPFIMFLL